MALSTDLEFETEDEFEFEDEFEDFLGAGEFGEGEMESEWEADGEWEFEDGEEFINFRKIGRGLLSVAKQVPWRAIAKTVAPMVGTAVGGPLGGALGKAASSLLEGEFEDEFEDEYEDEYEDEFVANLPVNPAAELMAAVASQARSDAEADAMSGAATLLAISPADRRELRTVLPYMVRGTAVLTKVLRSRPETRPAVRVVPEIVRRSSATLARRGSAGQSVNRRTAARVMARQTRRVLGNPRTCSRAIQTNARASQAARRRTTSPNRQRR
ncbi:hypothetical protein [Mycolicibacterium vaccae]|uniref:hypothetical protein n=1 Tax=Mycolicibacterium vaccae TaxID=1810 RepID=UPI003CFCA826